MPLGRAISDSHVRTGAERLRHEVKIATRARFVPLTKAQLRKAQRQYNTAIKNRRNY